MSEIQKKKFNGNQPSNECQSTNTILPSCLWPAEFLPLEVESVLSVVVAVVVVEGRTHELRPEDVVDASITHFKLNNA